MNEICSAQQRPTSRSPTYGIAGWPAEVMTRQYRKEVEKYEKYWGYCSKECIRRYSPGSPKNVTTCAPTGSQTPDEYIWIYRSFFSLQGELLLNHQFVSFPSILGPVYLSTARFLSCSGAATPDGILIYNFYRNRFKWKILLGKMCAHSSARFITDICEPYVNITYIPSKWTEKIQNKYIILSEHDYYSWLFCQSYNF